MLNKSNKTYVQKTSEVKREWHLVDAEGQILGKMATQIATKLIGKHRPTYTANIESGDYVVVINAEKIKVTGNKGAKKIYGAHSGFPGGLRLRTFDEVMEKNPVEIIEKAVKNMVPKNRLRDVRMARLKVYTGTDHKHESQLKDVEKAK